MRIGALLSTTMLYAAALLAVALPLMAGSFFLALEIAPIVGVDLRGSVLESVVGAAIILGSVWAASKAVDVYVARRTPQ
jgi:hypothetical protein